MRAVLEGYPGTNLAKGGPPPQNTLTHRYCTQTLHTFKGCSSFVHTTTAGRPRRTHTHVRTHTRAHAPAHIVQTDTQQLDCHRSLQQSIYSVYRMRRQVHVLQSCKGMTWILCHTRCRGYVHVTTLKHAPGPHHRSSSQPARHRAKNQPSAWSARRDLPPAVVKTCVFAHSEPLPTCLRYSPAFTRATPVHTLISQ